MPMAQQVQVQMGEGTKVMEETQITQEAPSMVEVKPQVEAQANSEVQVTEDTKTISEMMAITQPIKRHTQATQTTPNKVKDGVAFVQDLCH